MLGSCLNFPGSQVLGCCFPSRIFGFGHLFEFPRTSSFGLLLVLPKIPSIGQLLNFLRLEVLGNV